MKQVHPSYTFVASTKTITLTGLNIEQDQLLLIVNATRGVQYFNFADSSLRASVTSGVNTSVVLTDASTTGHSNSDALVIYYEDQATGNVVSGTVTANPGTGAFTVSGTVGLDNASLVALENITVTVSPAVLGTVTISNFPSTQTVAGTVTANVPNADSFIKPAGQGGIADCLEFYDEGLNQTVVAVHVKNTSGEIFGSNPFPISGTVTANASLIDFPKDNDVPYVPIAFVDSPGGSLVQVSQDANCGLPISGTVTANNPNGALTTRFGSVTTANTAQLTSAVTNTSRKYLLVQNIDSSTVTIGIGFAPTTTQGIQLPAGGGLTFDAFTPTGAIYWLSGVTGSNWSILEG